MLSKVTFYLFLVVEWVILFPIILLKVSRFSDIYEEEIVNGKLDKYLLISHDPDAELNFFIWFMLLLIVIGIQLFFLSRWKIGVEKKLGLIATFIPPVLSVLYVITS